MQITLEMVDEIINRTGVTYKEAKEALEATEGDLLKALVYLEDKDNPETEAKNAKRLNGQEIVAKLKAWVNEGMVNQITIKRNGKVILDIPVVAGALTAVIFTLPTVAAIIAAVATGCEIMIVKKDGEVVNINEFTQEKFDQVFKSGKSAPSEEAESNEAEETVVVEETVVAEDAEPTPEKDKEDWYQ